jgi:hypothetical protein
MFAFIAKNINVTTWLDQSVNAWFTTVCVHV